MLVILSTVISRDVTKIGIWGYLVFCYQIIMVYIVLCFFTYIKSDNINVDD